MVTSAEGVPEKGATLCARWRPFAVSPLRPLRPLREALILMLYLCARPYFDAIARWAMKNCGF